MNPYFYINFGQTMNSRHNELSSNYHDLFISASDSYFQLTHTSVAGTNVFVHPEFYNENEADQVSVCLIKTEENFMQMAADNGQELLMPFMFESNLQEGKACWTAGWHSDNQGVNHGENNEHPYLNVAGVNLISHDTCKNYAIDELKSQMNQYDICAGNPENDGTQFINNDVAGTLSFTI